MKLLGYFQFKRNFSIPLVCVYLSFQRDCICARIIITLIRLFVPLIDKGRNNFDIFHENYFIISLDLTIGISSRFIDKSVCVLNRAKLRLIKLLQSFEIFFEKEYIPKNCTIFFLFFFYEHNMISPRRKGYRILQLLIAR